MKKLRYHMTLDRNGTEDEITIRDPKGQCIAFIWFWNDEGDELARVTKDATLIVDALNAYRPV